MIKDTLRKWCPNFIHKWYADTKFWIRFKWHPQGLASEIFRGVLGYDISWDDPKDLNEKINWMKFNYDTSEWTRLADKYLVRDYVKERIGETVLPQVYGAWERASDIDFEKLPERFVLKTNHGCGMVIPVKDKSILDDEGIRKKLDMWLKERYGYDTVEPHYLKIHPLIYAEELLENDTDFSSSLVDYKVFCFSGEPYCIMVCIDREIGQHADFYFYDTKWDSFPPHLAGKHHKDISIPKPKCLSQLLDYASKLAEGHPQVRVDFYIIKNKIYFGEMTFTSQGGYMDYISRELSYNMGQLVKLPCK
ncbi:MAG: hypothetical protein IJ914_05665 [Prevotella sp.]|nr:hypothetical protein [Prevotella sp.]